MRGDKLPASIEEECGRQGHLTVLLAQTLFRVKQHVGKRELAVFQIVLQGGGVFTLIREDEVDIGPLLLRLSENRHFAAAGWAPRRPQVHNCWLAGGQVGKVCRVPLVESEE